MPLPTSQIITAFPAESLPNLLHRTRTGGMRAHCSAARLAVLVAAGEVRVSRTSIAIPANTRLPPRVGSEGDDHRLLRAAGRLLILRADPAALVGMEVTLACGSVVRRFDGFAATRFGVIAAYAGASDGRDIAALLSERMIAHAVVLPFAGLQPDSADAVVFSHASSSRLPAPLA